MTSRRPWLTLVALLVASEMGAQERGRLVGRVVAQETREPLPYSVVSVPALGLDLFADDSGRFLLSGLSAGPVEITVRRLGFRPATITVPVRVGESDTVTIALPRLAIQLQTVIVRAHPPCRNPGAPSLERDSTLAAIFQQLQLNARQFHVLSEQYPFTYTMQVQRSRRTRKTGSVISLGQETQEVSSRLREEYRPGRMIRRDSRGSQVFFIPTLVDFAHPDFIDSHCFHYAGLEHIGDSTAVRVDVVAAERLRTADVSGSIYLDSRSYQIVRTLLHLSRKPASVRDVAALEVTTEFQELFPSIPFISSVWSVITMEPSRRRSYDEVFEFHRIRAVNFEGAIPGRP